MFLYVPEDREQQFLFIVFLADLSLVDVIHELQKEESHGDLIGAAFVWLFVVQSPDEIFYQILDGQNVCHVKMKVIYILAAGL